MDEGAMQKEECRRLVWAALTLAASYGGVVDLSMDREFHHLWIKDAANVSPSSEDVPTKD